MIEILIGLAVIILVYGVMIIFYDLITPGIGVMIIAGLIAAGCIFGYLNGGGSDECEHYTTFASSC